MTNQATKIRVSFEGKDYYPEVLNFAVTMHSQEPLTELITGLNRVATVVKKIKEELVSSVPEYAVSDANYLAKEQEAVYAHCQYELRILDLNNKAPVSEEEAREEQANLVYVEAKDVKHDAFMTAVITALPDQAFFVQKLLSHMPDNWISSKNCNVPEFFIE